MIEVRLLGPPRLTRDGEPVVLDTRKALALLALLVLSDRPRTRDGLADLLWPDADLARARGALRRTLSTLRAAIGPEHLEAARDHVALRRGPGLDVDVDRFRSLRDAGSWSDSAAVATGTLLEGFAVRDAPEFDDWVAAEEEVLRRELSGVLCELATERRAAGDLVGATAAVRRWLRLDPLQEPAHQALVRILAESGDRAGAVAAYRACVRVLDQELGVPPLAETTALHDAVSAGTLDAPRPLASTGVPSTLTGPSTPSAPSLVGRDREREQLVEAHRRATAGGVAVVTGETGIGRTRLLEELVARVRTAGGTVLLARGHADESGLAYGPLIELLRACRWSSGGDGGPPRWSSSGDEGFPRWSSSGDEGSPRWSSSGDEGAAYRDPPPTALAQAARLVPDLATGRRLPAVGAWDEPGAEARFLDGLWQVLAAAVAGPVPGLLVLDDAQWADEASLRMLTYAARRLEGRGLLMVLAWSTPTASVPLTSFEQVARAVDGTVVNLGRLDRTAVTRWVREAGGDDEAVASAWSVSEGVPLLVSEALATGRTGSVADLMRARVARVSETAHQVLTAAAVLGRSFGVDEVRQVSGRTDEETVLAVEELVAQGLVREREADYDFDHHLVRSVVLESTSLARRRLLHGRAAGAVTGTASRARHLHEAGREQDAATAYRQAGQEARAVHANGEAISLLRTALALGVPERAAVLVELADVQVLAGDYAGALTALAAAAAEPAAELRTVEHRLARLQLRRGEPSLAAAHLEAALRTTTEEELPARAAITADLALALLDGGQRDEAQRVAGDAAALATRTADPGLVCRAENVLGLVATADGRLDEAVTHLVRAHEVAGRTDDPELRVASLNNLALARRAQGDLEAAGELTTQALGLCVALGDRHREAALLNNLADLLHAAGREDEAMERLKTAVEIFAEVGAQEQDPLRPEVWKLSRW